jgi:putative flippase GtrA
VSDRFVGVELKNVIEQGGRYLLIGFSSAAIELVLFYILYEVLGLYVVAGNITAITVATAFNFIMSYSWTFKSASSLPRSLGIYLLLFAFNQLFSNFAIVWLIGLGLPSMLAKIITMGCIVLWNFVLYRKVVFK